MEINTTMVMIGFQISGQDGQRCNETFQEIYKIKQPYAKFICFQFN